jgi:fluoride exporter
MSASLWVMAGSALGGLARYWLTIAVAMATRSTLPWGTLLINVIGAFVIGWFGTLTAPGGRFTVPADTRLFVMVGLCGGFTTFSAFSLQTFELIQAEAFGWAAAYVLGSVALCLIGVWAGFAATR